MVIGMLGFGILTVTNFSLIKQHSKFRHAHFSRAHNTGRAGKLQNSDLVFTGFSVFMVISRSL